MAGETMRSRRTLFLAGIASAGMIGSPVYAAGSQDATEPSTGSTNRPSSEQTQERIDKILAQAQRAGFDLDESSARRWATASQEEFAEEMKALGVVPPPTPVDDSVEIAAILLQISASDARWMPRPMPSREMAITRGGTDVTAAAVALSEHHGITIEQAVHQLEIEQLATVFAEKIVDDFGSDDRFGGLWLNPGGGGHLTVAILEDSIRPELTERLRALKNLGALQFELVREPYRAFDDVVDDFLRTLPFAEDPSLGGAGRYIQITPLTQARRIEVLISAAIPNDYRSKVREVVERWPHINVALTEVDRTFESNDACNTTSVCTPHRAGMEVRHTATNARCSAGYSGMIINGGFGYDAYLTSGHCVKTGSAPVYWKHNGTNMSWQSTAVDSGPVDAMMMYRTGHAWTEGVVRRSPTTQAWPIDRVNTRTGLLLGSQVCRSGAVSAQDCGDLISNTVVRGNNTKLGRGEHVGSCEGDSGGPYFAPAGNSATGLTHSSDQVTPCPATYEEDSYFSYLSEITAVLPFVVDT